LLDLQLSASPLEVSMRNEAIAINIKDLLEYILVGALPRQTPAKDLLFNLL
jgi:hypothetical protein